MDINNDNPLKVTTLSDSGNKESVIEIGSVVSTSSHNHKMTVRSIENNTVTCDYFIGNEPHQETYDLDELRLVVD